MNSPVTEIVALEYGRSTMSEKMAFENSESDARRPIVFLIYLIKQGEKLILADAGCDTMPGWNMEGFIGPVKALERIGVAPSDITDVIITHSHHDHAEGTHHFKNADIYVQKDEYKLGIRYFPSELKVHTFENELQLTDSIRAVKIGGHSVGSCVVEIDRGEKTAVIAGDECYLFECLDKRVPTGTSCCPQKSREFIEKYASPRYELLLCHDVRRFLKKTSAF